MSTPITPEAIAEVETLVAEQSRYVGSLLVYFQSCRNIATDPQRSDAWEWALVRDQVRIDLRGIADDTLHRVNLIFADIQAAELASIAAAAVAAKSDPSECDPLMMRFAATMRVFAKIPKDIFQAIGQPLDPI